MSAVLPRVTRIRSAGAHSIWVPIRPPETRMVGWFAAGVTLADGQTLAPAEVGPAGPDPCVVRVVLHQGVYHQIKRMFGVFGAGVNGLHREAIGPVALDPALAPGQWRELTGEEVSALRAAAGKG